MFKIFSYGTLWKEDVQIREFGTKFKIDPDLDYVSGWDLITLRINDEVYKVMIEGKSTISGAIVHVPTDLIDQVDRYEGEEYKRIEITTLSGEKCQVYVKR